MVGSFDLNLTVAGKGFLDIFVAEMVLNLARTKTIVFGEKLVRWMEVSRLQNTPKLRWCDGNM
jgi:hypothetical protein